MALSLVLHRHGSDWTLWRSGALDSRGDPTWQVPQLVKAVVDADSSRVVGSRQGEAQSGAVVLIANAVAGKGDMMAQGDNTASPTPTGDAKRVASVFELVTMTGDKLWQIHLG